MKATSAPPAPTLACPRCRLPLDSGAETLVCTGCRTTFPIVAGIPDLRVAPDPWIGLEDDRDKALRLVEATAGMSFDQSVQAYWAMTPDTPRDRAARFIAHVRRAGERSREWIASLPRPVDGAPWLDVGCGTGDLAAAVRAAGGSAVGVDVALRWLVLARKRPALEDATFVCANAEALPFADASFGCAAALGLLEHCQDPRAVCAELGRVVRHGGTIRLRTVNRYSVLREPHVGVVGVGYVPRAFQNRYVRWRTGKSYRHHRPLSIRELRAALRATGVVHVAAGAARRLRAETEGLGPFARAMTPVYEVARRLPVARRALAWVAPLLEAEAEVA